MHPLDQRLIELERRAARPRRHARPGLWQLERGDDPAPRARLAASSLPPRLAPIRPWHRRYEQRVHAAVLSAGHGAFASHETAARAARAAASRAGAARDHDIGQASSDGRAGRTACTDSCAIDDDRRRHAQRLGHRGLQPGADDLQPVDSLLPSELLGRMVDDAVRRRIMTLDDLEEIVEFVRRTGGSAKMRIVRRRPGAKRGVELAIVEVASRGADRIATVRVAGRVRRPAPMHRSAHAPPGTSRRLGSSGLRLRPQDRFGSTATPPRSVAASGRLPFALAELRRIDSRRIPRTRLALEAEGFRWYQERARLRPRRAARERALSWPATAS